MHMAIEPRALPLELKNAEVWLHEKMINIKCDQGLITIYQTDAGWRVSLNGQTIVLDHNWLAGLMFLGLE